MTGPVTVMTPWSGPAPITGSSPHLAPAQMTIHATCQRECEECGTQAEEDRGCISYLWLKVVGHKIVPQIADCESAKTKALQ